MPLIFKKFREKIFLIFFDLLAINLSFFIVFWIKFKSGLFHQILQLPLVEFIIPALMLYAYWLIIFTLAGLYKSWYAQSRFDEIVLVFKAVIIGVVIFYFMLFFSNKGNISRSVLVIYTSSLLFFVSVGRLLLRTIQRNLLIKGIGAKNVAIVGSGAKAIKIANEIKKYPALGFRFIGFIDSKNGSFEKDVLLGNVSDIKNIVKDFKINDIIFALEKEDRDFIIQTIVKCDNAFLDFYILPEFYDIVAGHLKTNQIYGFPLIKLFPSPMSPLEEGVKRLMDIVFSLVGIIISLPISIIVAILIKLDSKGPVLFKQERVGKDGQVFKILKFRTMIHNAEKHTGPTWAKKNDSRITRIGKFLRRTRIDEIPQFINILKGEMSLVGPRPERPYFVEQFKKQIPLYTNRLKVKPGLTGYAQVKHKYDASLDDVKEKLKYDLYYIENMSIRLDIKIILRTIWIVLFPGDKVH